MWSYSRIKSQIQFNPIKLFAGGTLNKDGTLYIRSTKIPGENALDLIAKTIEQTQMRKAPIEKFAGSYSSIASFNLYSLHD
jgi:cation transport ATPase